MGVELSEPSVSRLAGEIMAVGDHWTLTNFSRANSYVVDNIEGSGEHIQVAPGRRAAPIPFELARIVIPPAAGEAVPFEPLLAPGQSTTIGSRLSLSGTCRYRASTFTDLWVGIRSCRARDDTDCSRHG